MNRRTFVEALAAAVGSVPLLGSLLPTPNPDPIPNPTPSNSFEYLNGTIQAGEYIPAGAAVYTGQDGKLYRVRTGRVDSEGNMITFNVTVADVNEPRPSPVEYSESIAKYCRGEL